MLKEIGANWKTVDFLEKVTNELLHKNRFRNNKLDGLVDNLLKMTCPIDKGKGEIFYRARKYNDKDAATKLRSDNGEGVVFWGYSKYESMSPPPEKVTEGRCNPKGISYLYTSESRDCAVYEVNPYVGEYISVATIEVVEALRIFYIDASRIKDDAIKANPLIEGASNDLVINEISNWFSRPVVEKDYYIATQYICEKIKEKYDGIAFKSSVYNEEDNINYVIFDSAKCNAISSELVCIHDRKFDIKDRRFYLSSCTNKLQ